MHHSPRSSSSVRRPAPLAPGVRPAADRWDGRDRSPWHGAGADEAAQAASGTTAAQRPVERPMLDACRAFFEGGAKGKEEACADH